MLTIPNFRRAPIWSWTSEKGPWVYAIQSLSSWRKNYNPNIMTVQETTIKGQNTKNILAFFLKRSSFVSLDVMGKSKGVITS